MKKDNNERYYLLEKAIKIFRKKFLLINDNIPYKHNNRFNKQLIDDFFDLCHKENITN